MLLIFSTLHPTYHTPLAIGQLSPNSDNMKIKFVSFCLFLAFMLLTCTQTKELVPTQVRNLNPSNVSSYHQPINMTIAWVPYSQESKLVKTKKGEWKIVKDAESNKSGNVPVILLTYPNSNDTIWIDMNTDTELLGKLVKHTLMTQEPIKRPFVEYFEEASCQKCHPSDVKVNFD